MEKYEISEEELRTLIGVAAASREALVILSLLLGGV